MNSWESYRWYGFLENTRFSIMVAGSMFIAFSLVRALMRMDRSSFLLLLVSLISISRWGVEMKLVKMRGT